VSLPPTTTTTASTGPKIVFLDSHPLSTLAGPSGAPAVTAITVWAVSLLAAGHRLYVPEVIDYELRRELIRAGKVASVRELDAQKTRYRYTPITTEAMLLAAALWARMRNSGTPTGDPKKLDIDVILAAQALTEGGALGLPLANVIVATSNVAHLARLVNAEVWQNIQP
jgi:predicted nucleic acid-binding protein